MENIEVKVQVILSWFLYQNEIAKAESEDGSIKVYKVGDNLVRVDIKIMKGENKS